MLANEDKEKLPKGTSKHWVDKTKDIENLPEKKAFLNGMLDYFQELFPSTYTTMDYSSPLTSGEFLTLDKKVKNIEEDNRLTREQKEQLKREILASKSEVTLNQLANTNNDLLTTGLGFAPALGLGYLLNEKLENQSPYLKWPILGATVLGGGLLGKSLINAITGQSSLAESGDIRTYKGL